MRHIRHNKTHADYSWAADLRPTLSFFSTLLLLFEPSSAREKWLSHSGRSPLKGYCHLHFFAFLSWITDFLFSLFALSSVVLTPFPNSFQHRCAIYSRCETVREISVMGSHWIMRIR